MTWKEVEKEIDSIVPTTLVFDGKYTCDFQPQMDKVKQFIRSLLIKQAEEIGDGLIFSLPSDAENLSTLTSDQALKVIKNYKKWLDSYIKELKK